MPLCPRDAPGRIGPANGRSRTAGLHHACLQYAGRCPTLWSLQPANGCCRKEYSGVPGRRRGALAAIEATAELGSTTRWRLAGRSRAVCTRRLPFGIEWLQVVVGRRGRSSIKWTRLPAQPVSFAVT